MHVYAGEFRKIYDPSKGETEPWYINDHTLIRGADGWHLFGITHREPANPLNEILCAHAVGEDLLNGEMKKLPPPFSAEQEKGEAHFWAPHVIFLNGLYYMFYCAGSLEGHDRYRLHLAVSRDLYTWEKHPENPLVIDGFDARDPYVCRIGEKWIMYYTCNTSPEGGNHCVACVESDDLIHWHSKRSVFVSSLSGTCGGPCESPFVKEYRGKYYLFIGPFGGYGNAYSSTAVYESANPFAFPEENLVGRIPSHAAEIIETDGMLYITHCGWGQGGVYLAPLFFEE